MSSSVYSKFRRTARILTTTADLPMPKLSEHKYDYPEYKPDAGGEKAKNTFGTRVEFFSKNSLAMCSGTGRIKDGFGGGDYKTWA